MPTISLSLFSVSKNIKFNVNPCKSVRNMMQNHLTMKYRSH